MTVIPVTVGICAYNEAGNIERAVRSIYEQDLCGFDVLETIVVSSASVDGTDDIVKGLAAEYPNLVLVRQERREGKNSAINRILDEKKTDIVVIFNADNIFERSTSLQKLLEPFNDDRTGIVGGRPIPTNDKKTFVGFAVHMIWTMHHHISMSQPKIGELIAFRDIGFRLPVGSQSDEDRIKISLEEKGYLSVYAPEAYVLNRGPETVSDFVKQRVRVNAGECYLRRDCGYRTPTWDRKLVIPAIGETVKDLGFRPFKILFGACLEAYSRSKAKSHVRHCDDDMNVWDPVKTTKKL